MSQQSLATALRAALEIRRTGPVTEDNKTVPLIEAIKNSTTRMDLIVLRRIGLHEEPPKDLK